MPFPAQGDFPNPGIELASLASPTLAAELFAISTRWEAHIGLQHHPIPCASQAAQWVKNLPARAGDMRRGFSPWVRTIPCRRGWLPTLVYLPGESHRQMSLEGYSSQGYKETRLIS